MSINAAFVLTMSTIMVAPEIVTGKTAEEVTKGLHNYVEHNQGKLDKCRV